MGVLQTRVASITFQRLPENIKNTHCFEQWHLGKGCLKPYYTAYCAIAFGQQPHESVRKCGVSSTACIKERRLEAGGAI